MLQHLTGRSKSVCATWALSTDIFFLPPCTRWRTQCDCLCWEFKMFIWIALIKNQCNDCQNQKLGSLSRIKLARFPDPLLEAKASGSGNLARIKPARRWFSDRDPLVVAVSCPRGRDSVQFWNDEDDNYDAVMVIIMIILMLTIIAMMMLIMASENNLPSSLVSSYHLRLTIMTIIIISSSPRAHDYHDHRDYDYIRYIIITSGSTSSSSTIWAEKSRPPRTRSKITDIFSE